MCALRRYMGKSKEPLQLPERLADCVNPNAFENAQKQRPADKAATAKVH